MSENRVTWVDFAGWRNRWDILTELPSGAQGYAFKVSRKNDGRIAFLKSIKNKKDPERRARFFREASAYDAIRVVGTPRLIESNAQRHGDKSPDLYIATEFVNGPTLSEWRKSNPRGDIDAAVATTRSLLATLRECHAKDCVHRDIKPDNIILVDADPARTVLLDFGLNYHETPSNSFQTEVCQQVGNRFLSLPELSAGSMLKQDSRSDLSFAAGILFYMLTGSNPDILQDAEGRLPHQRRGPVAALLAVAGARYGRLASLFDSAFAPHIVDRFTSADALLTSIENMMADPAVMRSTEDELAAILEIVDSAAERRRAETATRFAEALRHVQGVHRDVAASLQNRFVLMQGGLSVDGDVGTDTMSWYRLGSNDILMSTKCEVKEAGDEILFRMSGDAVYRTSIISPEYGETFSGAIRKWVIQRVFAALSDPLAFPPEATYFVELTPFGTLSEAAENARRMGRPVLAFVYDPAQKERGRLGYGLSNFLQNKKTRDTIDATFVVALVPLSQTAGALDGLSMESSRWVVFNADLVLLEEAVIYANAQEAEEIALGLATRYRGNR